MTRSMAKTAPIEFHLGLGHSWDMRSFAKLGATLVLTILAALGGLGWWLSGSQPRNDGNLRLPGLKAAVTVARDDTGVPRIIAESDHDAYF